MDDISQLGEQARMFFEHHVPAEVTMPLFIAMPIGLIVVGLGLAVLGAKMAKPALAVAFTLAGVVGGGLVLGAATGVAPGIGMLIGGLVCGVTGYMLHRLWVGLAAAILISTLAGVGFGAQSLLPALQAYDVEFPHMAAADANHFTVPEKDREAKIFSTEFQQWVEDSGDWGLGFWKHASASNTRLTRFLPMVAFGAGLVGLVLGLLAPRLMMISLTSVIGVAFMMSGSTVLTHRFEPVLYASAVGHPRAMGMACGALLLGSLILQTLLTRSDKPKSKKQDKS